MLNAIEPMTAEQKARIAGVVFFGYTKNKQENGEIPNFPANKLKVFCRPDDGVCDGALVVTAGHLGYSSDGSIGQAVDFLSQKIDSFSGGANTSSGVTAAAPATDGIDGATVLGAASAVGATSGMDTAPLAVSTA